MMLVIVVAMSKWGMIIGWPLITAKTIVKVFVKVVAVTTEKPEGCNEQDPMILAQLRVLIILEVEVTVADEVVAASCVRHRLTTIRIMPTKVDEVDAKMASTAVWAISMEAGMAVVWMISTAARAVSMEVGMVVAVQAVAMHSMA